MEGESSLFGRFIHDSIPDSLRVNPFAVEVTPCVEIQKQSFSIREYTQNNELNVDSVESDCEAVDETLDENTVPVSPHESPESGYAVLEEVEEDDLTSQQLSSSTRTFSSFMFDVYQSASFYVPNIVVQQRSRLQYVQEYYRRMITLLESSKKQIPASEEALSSLVIVIWNLVLLRLRAFFLLWNGVLFVLKTILIIR